MLPKSLRKSSQEQESPGSKLNRNLRPLRRGRENGSLQNLHTVRQKRNPRPRKLDSELILSCSTIFPQPVLALPISTRTIPHIHRFLPFNFFFILLCSICIWHISKKMELQKKTSDLRTRAPDLKNCKIPPPNSQNFSRTTNP